MTADDGDPDAPLPDDTYTHGHHESVLRSHTWRTVENSAHHLLAHLRPGLDVLDVGCGPGTITADLAARVAPGRVVGLDRSAEVVAQAAAACAEQPHAEVRTGDVYALPFPDGSFDVVHAHQVLQHLSDPVAALGEMRRVCRPDGLVAVRDADYGAFSWAPADPVLDAWRDLYRAVARSNDAEPDAGRHLRGWAVAAGFSSVEATASAWCFGSAEERTWWGELWAERTTESAFAAQAVATGLATAADLEAMAAAFRRWAAATDTAVFLVPHGEVLARP